MAKKLFFLLFVCNLAFNFATYRYLPDQIAIHFGANGHADSWASKDMNFNMFMIVNVFFFLLFAFSANLFSIIPQRLINLPNKDFWIKEENVAEMKAKFSRLMYEFGAAMFAFLLIVSALAFNAQYSTPAQLNNYIFLPVLLLYLGYCGFWSVRLFREYQVPEDSAT
jgi:uncharacterized membrane protein